MSESNSKKDRAAEADIPPSKMMLQLLVQPGQLVPGFEEFGVVLQKPVQTVSLPGLDIPICAIVETEHAMIAVPVAFAAKKSGIVKASGGLILDGMLGGRA